MSTDASKTCLVCAPGGTDLSELSGALQSRGYRLVAPSAIPGRPWLAALRESLGAVDLVVAVLPDTSSSVLSTVFELGVAAALDRVVLLVVDPKFDELPLAISGMRVVRAPVTSREAIDFALDALATPPRTAEIKPSARTPTTPPRIATDAIERKLAAASAEAEIIAALAELFSGAGAEVVSEARVGPRCADLAIWSDAMAPYMGNPLVVDVNIQLGSRTDVQRALATLTSYVHASGAPWGLLLYKNGSMRQYVMEESRKTARVLVLSFDELLNGIRAAPLFDLLRDLRNRKVHGVP